MCVRRLLGPPLPPGPISFPSTPYPFLRHPTSTLWRHISSPGTPPFPLSDFLRPVRVTFAPLYHLLSPGAFPSPPAPPLTPDAILPSSITPSLPYSTFPLPLFPTLRYHPSPPFALPFYPPLRRSLPPSIASSVTQRDSWSSVSGGAVELRVAGATAGAGRDAPHTLPLPAHTCPHRPAQPRRTHAPPSRPSHLSWVFCWVVGVLSS